MTTISYKMDSNGIRFDDFDEFMNAFNDSWEKNFTGSRFSVEWMNKGRENTMDSKTESYSGGDVFLQELVEPLENVKLKAEWRLNQLFIVLHSRQNRKPAEYELTEQ